MGENESFGLTKLLSSNTCHSALASRRLAVALAHAARSVAASLSLCAAPGSWVCKLPTGRVFDPPCHTTLGPHARARVERTSLRGDTRCEFRGDDAHVALAMARLSYSATLLLCAPPLPLIEPACHSRCHHWCSWSVDPSGAAAAAVDEAVALSSAPLPPMLPTRKEVLGDSRHRDDAFAGSIEHSTSMEGTRVLSTTIAHRCLTLHRCLSRRGHPARTSVAVPLVVGPYDCRRAALAGVLVECTGSDLPHLGGWARLQRRETRFASTARTRR